MARSTPFCDAYIDIRRTKSILDVELYMYDMISAKHLLASYNKCIALGYA